jgi:hypothetical protein
MGLDHCPCALFQEERVALGLLNEALLERCETAIVAQQGTQQGLRAVGAQGVEPELAIGGLRTLTV